MANTIRRFNPLLVFLAIALTWCCVGNIDRQMAVCAARGTPVVQSSSSSDVNMKKPDCLDDAGRVLIPGVGSSYVTSPPDDDQTSQSSSSSSSSGGGPLPPGGSDSAGTADTDPAAGDLETGPGYSPPEYIPGNDDTFFPNPGYEVPIGVHANTNSVKAP